MYKITGKVQYGNYVGTSSANIEFVSSREAEEIVPLSCSDLDDAVEMFDEVAELYSMGNDTERGDYRLLELGITFVAE